MPDKVGRGSVGRLVAELGVAVVALHLGQRAVHFEVLPDFGVNSGLANPLIICKIQQSLSLVVAGRIP